MQTEHTEKFSTASSIKSIISDLGLTKQKPTKITPFEAHFGRSADSPIKYDSFAPSSLNLTLKKLSTNI